MIAELDRAQPALDFMGIGEAQTAAEKIRVATGGLVNQLGRLRALAVEFYERRGHIALGYSSIEECAKREFGWHRTTFWRALQTATIERQLGVEVGTLPGSHAAALKRLPAADRAEAYSAAGDGATAADVRAEVERRLPREEPLPEPEPFAPLGEPGTSATAFNTDLPTDDDPAPLCHECGEAVPGALEDGLPVICDTCAPGYFAEPAPDHRAMPRAAPPVAEKGPMPSPWGEADRERRAAAVVVTETVGSSPAPQSRVAANGEAGAASSAQARPKDGGTQETADDDWTAGLIDRAFFLKRGMSLADALRIARAVVETAENPEAGSRRRMAARAWLKGEVG